MYPVLVHDSYDRVRSVYFSCGCFRHSPFCMPPSPIQYNVRVHGAFFLLHPRSHPSCHETNGFHLCPEGCKSRGVFLLLDRQCRRWRCAGQSSAHSSSRLPAPPRRLAQHGSARTGTSPHRWLTHTAAAVVAGATHSRPSSDRTETRRERSASWVWEVRVRVRGAFEAFARRH